MNILKNIIILLISLILYYITFLLNKRFLEFQPILIYKILSGLIIFIFIKYISIIIDKYRANNEKTKIFVKCFLFYLLINIGIYILVYPGLFTGEDLMLLCIHPHHFEINAWYNWLTNLYYALSITLTSSIIGVVPIQLILLSGITAYFITDAYMLYKNKWAFLLFIPFLFPSVLMLNQYTFRFTIISFLLFFFISKMIFKYIKHEKFTYLEVIWFSVLVSIIIIWRAEFCFNVILIPAYFALLFYKTEGKKKILLFSSIILLLATIGICHQWSLLKKQDIDKKYLLSSVHGTACRIISMKSLLTKDLDDVAKIMNFFEELKKDPNYIPENINEVLTAQRKFLIIYAPQIIYSAFINSNNLREFLSFDEEINARDNINNSKYNKEFNKIPICGIFGNKVRLKICAILDCTYYNQKFKEKTPLFSLFYNMAFPYLFIYIGLFIGILTNNKHLWGTSLLLIINLMILTFTTACTGMFYYHLPYYYCGWFLFSLFIYIFINKKYQKKVEQNIE